MEITQVSSKCCLSIVVFLIQPLVDTNIRVIIRHRRTRAAAECLREVRLVGRCRVRTHALMQRSRSSDRFDGAGGDDNVDNDEQQHRADQQQRQCAGISIPIPNFRIWSFVSQTNFVNIGSSVGRQGATGGRMSLLTSSGGLVLPLVSLIRSCAHSSFVVEWFGFIC